MIHMHPRLATKIHSIIGSIYQAQLKMGKNLSKNWGHVLANFACIYEKGQSALLISPHLPQPPPPLSGYLHMHV